MTDPRIDSTQLGNLQQAIELARHEEHVGRDGDVRLHWAGVQKIVDALAKLDSARPEPSGDAEPNEAERAPVEPSEVVELSRRVREGRGLLHRLVKYVREDRAETPGTTRLARLVETVDDYLKRTHNAADILRAESSEPVKQGPAQEVVERAIFAGYVADYEAGPKSRGASPFRSASELHAADPTSYASRERHARAAIQAMGEATRTGEALGMARERVAKAARYHVEFQREHGRMPSPSLAAAVDALVLLLERETAGGK